MPLMSPRAQFPSSNGFADIQYEAQAAETL